MITVWDWPEQRTNWSGEILNTGFCRWIEHDLCGGSTRSAYCFRYNTITILPYNGPKAYQGLHTTQKHYIQWGSFSLHYVCSNCSYLSQVSVVTMPLVLAGSSKFGCGKSLSSPWKRLHVHVHIVHYIHTYIYSICVYGVGDWLCCHAWWYAWSCSDLSSSAEVSEGELFVAYLASIVNA